MKLCLSTVLPDTLKSVTSSEPLFAVAKYFVSKENATEVGCNEPDGSCVRLC